MPTTLNIRWSSIISSGTTVASTLQFTPIVERLTEHEDGRTLASLADDKENFRLQMLPLPQNSGATSSAPSSTTGCATMWVRPLWKSSTAHLPTGWGCCQASAPTPRSAVMQA